MEGGRVAEIGNPQELIEDDESYFHKLAKSAGSIWISTEAFIRILSTCLLNKLSCKYLQFSHQNNLYCEADSYFKEFHLFKPEYITEEDIYNMGPSNILLKFTYHKFHQSFCWSWVSTQYILPEFTSLEWDLTLSNCFLKLSTDVSECFMLLLGVCFILKLLSRQERLSTEELVEMLLSWSLELLKLKWNFFFDVTQLKYIRLNWKSNKFF